MMARLDKASDGAKQYLFSLCAHLTILLIVLCKTVISSSPTAQDDLFSLPLQDKSLAEARINLNKFRFNNSRNPLIDFRNSRSFSSLTQLIRPSLYRPSLFHVVKFPNDECLDATNQTGVCYTSLECKAFGGTGSTSCAKGYGTCCSINRSCNQITSNKVTYFMNPSYPNSDTVSTYCAFTVEVRDPNVCQVRIDFLEFHVDQPTDGLCVGDKLTVTAGGLNARSIPILCGMNKDQHMYVNIPRSDRQRSASLLMQTNGNGAYRWRMRLTHVSCSHEWPAIAGSTVHSSRPVTSDPFSLRSNSIQRRSDERSERMLSKFKVVPFAQLKVTPPAPSGCLQYFTEPAGTIMSFNYGHYLANIDYAICIERLPTTCKVVFRAVDQFGISMYGGARQYTAGVGDGDCLFDYLNIPGGSLEGNSETRDRHCGTILSNTRGDSMGQLITTRSNGPIILRFHTGSTTDRSVKSGFKIMYEQSSNCEQLNQDPNRQTANGNLMGPFSLYSPTPVTATLYDGSEPQATLIESVDNKLTPEPGIERQSRSRSNTKKFRF